MSLQNIATVPCSPLLHLLLVSMACLCKVVLKPDWMYLRLASTAAVDLACMAMRTCMTCGAQKISFSVLPRQRELLKRSFDQLRRTQERLGRRERKLAKEQQKCKQYQQALAAWQATLVPIAATAADPAAAQELYAAQVQAALAAQIAAVAGQQQQQQQRQQQQ